MKQELYKPRSFQSCLKTAFDTVCSNAKTFIVNTWLPAILNALVIAAMITLKGDGITALAGVSAFLTDSNDRSANAKLSKLTKILAIIFVVITLLVYILQ